MPTACCKPAIGSNGKNPLGKAPALSELLLMDMIAGELGMVHGFAPLRCFRHEYFLVRSYQVTGAVGRYVLAESCGWLRIVRAIGLVLASQCH